MGILPRQALRRAAQHGWLRLVPCNYTHMGMVPVGVEVRLTNAQKQMLVDLTFVNLDERVLHDHPLRVVMQVADDVRDRMSADFDRMYSKIGRASVPPERRYW